MVDRGVPIHTKEFETEVRIEKAHQAIKNGAAVMHFSAPRFSQLKRQFKASKPIMKGQLNKSERGVPCLIF